MFWSSSYPQPILYSQRHSSRRREQQWQWVAITGILFSCGVFALPHDLSASRFFHTNGLPGGLNELLEKAETFAHGIGIAAILLVIFVVDIHRRWAVPRVILCAVSAGVAANVIKLLIGRLRPHSADLTAQISDSFTGVLPLFSVGSSERSCPSAHTTVVIAFAIGLCWLYPRGRHLFIGFAVLAATQRVITNAHFLSDVFWGAGLGYFLGRGIVAGWLTANFFNRWEANQYRSTSNPLDSAHPQIHSPSTRRRAA